MVQVFTITTPGNLKTIQSSTGIWKWKEFMGTGIGRHTSASVGWRARPYSYVGNNFENFYRTGSTWTNSVSLTGGGDNQVYRFSVTDLRNESIVPNSGFDRTNITLSTNGTYFKKLTLNAK
jgi:hypothetical protein